MSKTFIAGRHFQDTVFTGRQLEAGTYEDCRFERCSFPQADLSGIIFTDCSFEDCDLSGASLRGTAFRQVRFAGAKLLGLRFDDCAAFLLAFRFERCLMDYTSFYGLKVHKTSFSGCRLHGAEFASADMTEAVFDDCDLAGAVFEGTNLEKADLRHARNFSIDPEANRLRGARFSTDNVAGLLGKYGLRLD